MNTETRKRIYPTNCSKCGEEFPRKPNESITCPVCRDRIAKDRNPYNRR